MFSKSWATSLIGIVTGLWVAGPEILKAATLESGTVDWNKVGFAVGITLLGLLAKQFNATGGTK